MPHSLSKSTVIEKIIIVGLKRTKENVVRRELLFKENDILTTTDLLESVRRLKNLRIFSKVLPLLKLKEHNRIILTFEVEEKWTTIPYFNFSGGGDTIYAYAGIYDINSFGRYIETGVQYDNWDGESGGVVWFRDPRFLNMRLLAGADLWSTTRPRTLFTPAGKKQGQYILSQKKINLIFEKEIKEWLQFGITLELRQSQIIETSMTDLIDVSTSSLLTNKGQTNQIGSTLSIHLGNLNYDNYLVKGKKTSLYVKYAGDETGSDETLKKIEWHNTAFWRLPYKANIGFRFNAAAIATNNIQNYFYIGGFENIRGYFDGQFRSKAYWQVNAEYRIPSFQHNWLVIQHIFFLDAVNASNHLDELKNINDTVYSAGTGIRIISPKIYGFNGRLDIALLSSQKTQSFVSFGAQQFF
ncbi:MAG: BamA/TamA family outer membrane protein [Gammaproteobacteria bacterium]|nr:BamA/TamA family outer membrane protein [Gammaproteobacteria bacterium]